MSMNFLLQSDQRKIMCVWNGNSFRKKQLRKIYSICFWFCFVLQTMYIFHAVCTDFYSMIAGILSHILFFSLDRKLTRKNKINKWNKINYNWMIQNFWLVLSVHKLLIDTFRPKCAPLSNKFCFYFVAAERYFALFRNITTVFILGSPQRKSTNRTHLHPTKNWDSYRQRSTCLGIECVYTQHWYQPFDKQTNSHVDRAREQYARERKTESERRLRSSFSHCSYGNTLKNRERETLRE